MRDEYSDVDACGGTGFFARGMEKYCSHDRFNHVVVIDLKGDVHHLLVGIDLVDATGVVLLPSTVLQVEYSNWGIQHVREND